MSGIPSDEQILEALWAWDPLGVAEHRHEAKSEYDSLVIGVLRSLMAGGPSEVVQLLRSWADGLGINLIDPTPFLKALETTAEAPNEG